MVIIERGDITFYLSTIGSVAALFGLLWRVTVGATIKRLQQDMVTKLDLEREFTLLREWLRKEFVAKK